MPLNPLQATREAANQILPGIPFPGTTVASTMRHEDQLMSIGPVILHGFEAKPPLHASAEQQIALHKYVGGGRSIQVFGSQAGPLRWGGTMVPRGEYRTSQTTEVDAAHLNPIERAKELEILLHKGDPIDFIFGQIHYIVVVCAFNYDVIHRGEVEYDITVEILRDMSIPFIAPGSVQDTYFELLGITEDLRNIFTTLQESEPYIFLALSGIKAIEAGDKAGAALTALLLANAAVPTLGLLPLANQLARAAVLIKDTVRSLTS